MAISKIILEQASDWLVLIHSGEMTEQQHNEFLRWKNEHPDHRMAIDRMQKMIGGFAELPDSLTQNRVFFAQQQFKQQLQYKLAWILSPLILFGIFSYAAPWQLWKADLHTAKGQIQSTILKDGTRLVLASDSYVNIHYTDTQRSIELLQGEIFVETAKEASHAYRPIVVHSKNGAIEALGTQFDVQQDPSTDMTTVKVYQHAVELRPTFTLSASPVILRQGQQQKFSSHAVTSAQPMADTEPYWTQQLLIADNMPLAQVMQALYRYRKGYYVVPKHLKQLKINGVFSLKNTDQSLEALAQTYHLQLDFYSDYFLVVQSK